MFDLCLWLRYAQRDPRGGFGIGTALPELASDGGPLDADDDVEFDRL